MSVTEMSTFWFTEQGGFIDVGASGGPAASDRIGDLRPRCRALVSGTIRSTKISRMGASPAFRAQLIDGTGTLDLVFLGRRGIPGLDVGSRCTIEGTVLAKGRRLTVLNPLYRIEPPDGDAGTSARPADGGHGRHHAWEAKRLRL
jgi:hypothetical protein